VAGTKLELRESCVAAKETPALEGVLYKDEKKGRRDKPPLHSEKRVLANAQTASGDLVMQENEDDQAAWRNS
jgi:hypothetical protein